MERTTRIGALIAGAWLAGSCALPPADINLAPLFAHETYSVSEGEHVYEVLGGIASSGRRDGREHVALRPLFHHRETFADEAQAIRATTSLDFLFPLGHSHTGEGEARTYLFPFFFRTARFDVEDRRDIDWMVLPFLFGGSADDGAESYFAFFPFYGEIRNFLSYERVRFALFPLWAQSWKDEREAWFVLWPFFGAATGEDYDMLRILPFYAHSRVAGREESLAILWPFYTQEKRWLDSDQPLETSMLLPFYGRQVMGSFESTTVLPPFVGWAHDDDDFSSFQIWPIFLTLSGGDGENRPFERFYFRPFYARYRSKEIDQHVYLWPLIWDRSERFPEDGEPITTARRFMVLPFWQSWTTTHGEKRGSYFQLWPLVHSDHPADGGSEVQIFSPWPYHPHQDYIQRNLEPFLTLYRSESRTEDLSTTRGPLGIFRMIETNDDWRFSLPLLGGLRTTTRGRVEFSLLAGLLRFRTDDGLSFLPPAFPGPGFAPLDPEEELR
ncbi:MAG: hypothetical protein IPN34_27200 [Planctomycetes bacterium]|nr:hypothetical protein [Planctomycetota bacterium]